MRSVYLLVQLLTASGKFITVVVPSCGMVRALMKSDERPGPPVAIGGPDGDAVTSHDLLWKVAGGSAWMAKQRCQGPLRLQVDSEGQPFTLALEEIIGPWRHHAAHSALPHP